jgi:hypothetical protein
MVAWFQTSCIMRWINLFGIMVDGFESTWTCGRLVLLAMHACLLHIYNHAFTLFIFIVIWDLQVIFIVIYPRKSVMSVCE